MTTKMLMAGLMLAAAGSSHAVTTVLAEGFDSVAGLTASGWVQINNSTAPAANAWFQGNSGVFAAQSGAASSYAAANYLSTGALSGPVSNWLITPMLTLDSSSVLSFFVRNAGDSFLDTLEVRMSVAGASTNVGATPTSVGDFSILLGTYSSSTDGGWLGLNYTLSSLSSPTAARLAFRYIVDDVAVAGNYLGIDSVSVTAVPEPAAYLLFAMGLAGVMLRRRMAA